MDRTHLRKPGSFHQLGLVLSCTMSFRRLHTIAALTLPSLVDWFVGRHSLAGLIIPRYGDPLWGIFEAALYVS